MLIPFGILSASAGGPVLLGVAGYSGGSPSSSTVDKFAFPSDTRSTLATGLSGNYYAGGGVSNSAVAGYMTGGVDSNNANKFAFPSDTRSIITSVFTVNVYEPASMSNSGVAGYFGKGAINPPFGPDNKIRKLLFSTDTRSTLSASFSSALRIVGGGMSNSGVAGYTAGGTTTNAVSGGVATVGKLTYSTETTSDLGTGLSAGRTSVSGFSNRGVAGYSAGGVDTGSTSLTTVDKFAFPSDTRSTLGTGLSSASDSGAGFNNSGVAGYVARPDAAVDKFAFPSDTRSSVSGGLSVGRYQGQTMSDEGAF